MARSANKAAEYKEFSFNGKEFSYTGRIYPSMTNKGDKVDVTPMNITLNGVITIKGCKLMQSDKNTWIAFPNYKAKNGEYNSYIYVDKEFSQAEIDKVAAAAEEAIK